MGIMRNIRRRKEFEQRCRLDFPKRLQKAIHSEVSISRIYIEKNRYIPQIIYNQLKRRKICDHCHKPFTNCKPQIHHKIRVADGGSNELSNLMALHPECHKILDKQNHKE